MSQQEEKVLGDVKSFTVDRSKWYRGQGHSASSLLQEDGSMCCLGFYAEACGVDRQYLLGKKSPANIDDVVNVPWKTILLMELGGVQGRGNSDRCMDLMDINDSKSIYDDVRESGLKELFLKIGIEVVFI
jgi:hypothetical protein